MKSVLISFSVIVTVIILLYLSPIGYVIPGVFKIYGTGHTTAFLDDYKIFDKPNSLLFIECRRTTGYQLCD